MPNFTFRAPMPGDQAIEFPSAILDQKWSKAKTGFTIWGMFSLGVVLVLVGILIQSCRTAGSAAVPPSSPAAVAPAKPAVSAPQKPSKPAWMKDAKACRDHFIYDLGQSPAGRCPPS